MIVMLSQQILRLVGVFFAIVLVFAQSAICVADTSNLVDGRWAGYVSSGDLYFVLSLQSHGSDECTGTVAFPRESDAELAVAHLACSGAEVRGAIARGSGVLDLDLRAGTYA